MTDMDVVSKYPKLAMNSEYGKTDATNLANGFPERRRKPRLPAWTGRHGSRAKGSVTRDAETGAWLVVFSFLIGYETTTRANELYYNWRTAVVEYMNHDVMVMKRQKVEDYRAIRAVK